MTTDQWTEYVKKIVSENNIEAIELLVIMLSEAEEAKQELRNKGYGWLGLSLLATVEEEVPYKMEHYE
jgi:hypothetical protein